MKAAWRSLRIGLVGPTGCGKSTIGGWLSDAGAVVIDADVVARAVLDPGEPALATVIERFGAELLRDDGSLDRAALGARVFGDPVALAALESVVHPVVRPRILAAIDDAEANGAETVVLEAIRLIDAGYGDLMDEVWFVTCDPEIQRARLMGRGLDPLELEQRVAAQRELLERAGAVAARRIETNAGIDETRRVVGDALDEARSARSRRDGHSAARGATE